MEPIQQSLNSLQRFQQLREQAVLRQHRETDPRGRLADVIGKKKMETGATGSVARPDKAPALSNMTSEIIGKSLKKAGELLLYDRQIQTQTEVQGARGLGNYVDLVG